MGKDLRVKELLSGISQRKDGFYIGRFENIKLVQKLVHWQAY